MSLRPVAPVFDASEDQQRYVATLLDPETPASPASICRLLQITESEVLSWFEDCEFVDWYAWQFEQRAKSGVPVAWTMVMKIAGDDTIDPKVRLQALGMYLDRFDPSSMISKAQDAMAKTIGEEMGKQRADRAMTKLRNAAVRKQLQNKR